MFITVVLATVIHLKFLFITLNSNRIKSYTLNQYI